MNRVLVVDDHALLRRGIQSIVTAWPGWEIAGESGTGEDAIDLAASLKPDVILMDISMPGMGGLEATRIICKQLPQIKVVLLTLHDSFESVRMAFQAGARGYLLKSDTEAEMMRALEIVAADGIYVSPRVDQARLRQLLGELGLTASPTPQTSGVSTGNGATAKSVSPNA
jgi:DNA-binding NarL/FixJ family response regulator